MAMLCGNCMKESQVAPVCEHCGYDNSRKNADHFLQIGTVLHGRYLLGRVLDNRGNYVRYVGYDKRNQETVIIRECFVDMNQTADGSPFEDRVHRELRIINSLQPDGVIIGPYKWFQGYEKLYAVEPFLRGQSLAEKIRISGKPLQAEHVWEIMQPVMESLKKLHEFGVFHLNIAPEQILLDEKNNVCLLGCSFASAEDAAADKRFSMPIVSQYSPVELLTARGVIGPWTDVYALCGVIYYCLTGRKPVDCANRLVDGWEPDWFTMNELSSSQKSALYRGMEFRPENRQQSMEQFMEDLFGTPFVREDPFTEEKPEPLGGVPVHWHPAGAMVYDPPVKPAGWKKWFQKKRK